MEQNAVTPSTVAPYGHACSNCARAKCKCTLRSNSGTCERCHRLGKQCCPTAQVRKRAKVNKSSNTRTSRLEDKLDNLVNLLSKQNSTLTTDDNASPESEGPKSTELSRLRTNKLTPESPEFIPHRFPSVWTPSRTCIEDTSKISDIHLPPVQSTSTQIDGNGPDDQLVDDSEFDLETFRTLHLQFYPFIYIPAGLKVQEFKNKWPFLWFNIRAICSNAMERQAALGLQIREFLAKQIVVEGERSMDLLLGLLVHMAWTYHFTRTGKPSMGVLSNMARSLLSDLRLDRPEGDAPGFTPEIEELKRRRIPGSTSRSNEERRALLATFIMSASISALLQYECLRWCPEMKRSAHSLLQNPEYPGDEVLVAMARLSKISSDAAKVTRRVEESNGLLLLHIKPLKAALDAVKASLPSYLLSNNVVLSYLSNAEATVYEIAIFQKPTLSLGTQFDTRRVQFLYACLEASKAAVENRLSSDVTQWPCHDFYNSLHCMSGLQNLHRLSFLQEPGWDVEVARQSANVKAYLERLASMLEAVHTHLASEKGIEVSIWSKGAQKLRMAFPKWSAGLGDADLTSTVSQDGIDFDPLLESRDDAWMTDFFSAAAWDV